MRSFHRKIELRASNGDVVRYIPPGSAQDLLKRGAAEIVESNGRIRAIALIETASSCAQRIGEPTGTAAGGTKFTRRVKSDAGVSWIEFHPRSTYTLD